MMDDLKTGHAELRMMLDAVYERLTSPGRTLDGMLADDMETGRRVTSLNSYAIADIVSALIGMDLVRPDNDRPIVDLNLAEKLLARALKIGTR